MMLHLAEVLTKDEVRHLRQKLDAAQWVDGRTTAGNLSARVKRNQQLPEHGELTRELGQVVLQALARHPLYFAAALPLHTVPPLFNRYAEAETYGFHVDGAMRKKPDSPSAEPDWLRTDLSATLFLCEPDEYEGGELTVKDTYGEHAAKLPAGDMVLYPANSLHCVTPVTQGVRTCSFFWIQSMIRDDKRRNMLFELDQTIQSLRARHGESAETLNLANCYHNLLREWSEL
ncbi:MAG TPA: Fe2+-dependent dioxygenase [Bordetella sp.]